MFITTFKRQDDFRSVFFVFCIYFDVIHSGDNGVRKNKSKSSRNFMERFTEAFQLPGDCTLGSTNMVMTGKTQLFIENYRNIIEYTDTSLKIQGKNGKVFITGKAIHIESYNADTMLVKGVFFEVKYF